MAWRGGRGVVGAARRRAAASRSPIVRFGRCAAGEVGFRASAGVAGAESRGPVVACTRRVAWGPGAGACRTMLGWGAGRCAQPSERGPEVDTSVR